MLYISNNLRLCTQQIYLEVVFKLRQHGLSWQSQFSFAKFNFYWIETPSWWWFHHCPNQIRTICLGKSSAKVAIAIDAEGRCFWPPRWSLLVPRPLHQIWIIADHKEQRKELLSEPTIKKIFLSKLVFYEPNQSLSSATFTLLNRMRGRVKMMKRVEFLDKLPLISHCDVFGQVN